MKYCELFKEENEGIQERYQLSIHRIEEICKEQAVPEPFRNYFQKMADFIIKIRDLVELVRSGELKAMSIEELKLMNQSLYNDIEGENYEDSYANPSYSSEKLGLELGRLLSFFYVEIRGMIGFAHEMRLTDITIVCETLIEIYNLFEEEIPKAQAVQKIIYWYISDYCDLTIPYRVRELVDPGLSFAKDLILSNDLKDLRYLYAYGEYISDRELETASFLNSLPEEMIELMAETYCEGYRKGFELAGIDLSRKQTVVIRYPIGFEAMVKAAIRKFEAMGLEPILYRYALNSVNKSSKGKAGYFGSSPNRQYEYDHRFDHALYLDKALKDRKIGLYKAAFERYKALARGQAGPAVIETFGEMTFQPLNKKESPSLNEKQQKLEVEYASESGQILNAYIPGDERSFTIIAFPVPEIGADFEEIFEETIRINTLNYELYRDIQQKLIDALDEAAWVKVRGIGKNETDIRVMLHGLDNPEKETKFENCVSDVNIPVGEVFTSPILKGTEGLLHVQQVFLEGIQYKDLKIWFRDGMTAEYTCSNFEREEENKALIKNHILRNHQTVPLGEFAIGTNTTAFAMARKYNIFDKLPILIAEKTGPHFAVGDTCYSWSEDSRVYNPDGKEIVAKDNEVSARRKEDISRAYFNCHTDITIPYHELDSIIAVREDGSEIPLIMEGKFVLPGTEELNKPLT